MSKTGMIGSYARFCLSGFGLGATPAKALGVVVLICTIGLVIAFYVIKWIIGLIRKNKAAKAEQVAAAPAVKPEVKPEEISEEQPAEKQ